MNNEEGVDKMIINSSVIVEESENDNDNDDDSSFFYENENSYNFNNNDNLNSEENKNEDSSMAAFILFAEQCSHMQTWKQTMLMYGPLEGIYLIMDF
jgi:hypothetical protein